MSRMIFNRTLLLSFALVICFATAKKYVGPSTFFYLLYPGEIASLLITGGHGGTQLQEWVAQFVSILLNVFVLTLLLNLIVYALRVLRRAHRAPHA